MSLVSRLKARLGLDTAEFSRGVDQAKRDASGLGGHMSQLTSRLKGGLAGMVAGLGITSTVVAMRDLTRSIANVGVEARRAGLDTTAFQQLSFVAKQNRIDVDVLVDGMKELNMRVDEFVATGGGSAADALTRLGFRASDLARGLRKPDDLFLSIIDRIKDLDRAAQLRTLDEMFGGSAGERFVELLDDGAEGIRTMMRQADDLGLVMDAELIAKADELDQKWDLLVQRASTFFKTVAVGAASAFDPVDRLAVRAGEAFGTDVVDDVAAAGNDVRAEVAAISDDVLKLGDDLLMSMDDTIASIMQGAIAARGFNQQHGDDLNALAQRVNDLRQMYQSGQIGPQEFAERLKEVTTEAQNTATAIDAMNEADLSGLVGKLGGVLSTINLVLSRATAAATAVQTTLSAVRIVADTEDPRGNTGNITTRNAPRTALRPNARPQDIDFGYTPPTPGKASGGGGAAPTSQYLEGLADLRAEITALQLETEEVTGVIGSALPYALEKARKQAELLAAAQAEGRDLTPALRTEVEQLADAYAKAGHEAELAAEKLQTVQENGKRGAEALASIFMAATKGAGSAKQAVASLLAQLAQSYALKGIMGFGSSGLPGSGLVAGLGALIGANANGTPNWRGGLTTVHERGGEIMDLPDGTRIIPNDISKRMADTQSTSPAGGHISVGFDASTGSLTATMYDVAGRVVARERSAIAGDAVGMVRAGNRKSKKFLGG